MLSNEDIREALAEKRLVIEPFNEKQIRAAGITLHLGSNLVKPLPGGVVDVKNGTLPEYAEFNLEEDRPYPLQPQEFILGHTLEKISVDETLGLFIEGRSTLARVGLTIVKTAMLVEPGHTNRAITLELANHGPNTILLYPEMKIARASIHELKTPSTLPYDANGKYRNQILVGKPIFINEFRQID